MSDTEISFKSEGKQEKTDRVPRFMPNPEANWGPIKRPRKKDETNPLLDK